ncbi:tetratricopeptide repeat protein [Streptomyces sp. NPDC048172]|uniref:tetratricopeptide repeat protein n=1 Tax=Streptomyces sp. NPDC048172 TaxID=3365505 RepID=UPI003717FA80
MTNALDATAPHQREPLNTDLSLHLLARLVGASYVTQEPREPERLTTACARVSLTVRLAAAGPAGLSDASVASAAAALACRARTTDERTTPMTPTLHATYDGLSPETARTYRLLGAGEQTVIDVNSTAAACAMELEDAATHLRSLAAVRLLEERHDRPWAGAFFRFRDEVREHARQRAVEEETGAGVEEAVRRWLDWFLLTCTRAERILTPAHRLMDRDVQYEPAQEPPFQDEDGALAWLEVHLSDLEVAVRAAEERGWDVLVWQLVHSAWPLFHRLRPLELWVDLHQRGLAAARRCGHRAAQREMLTTLVIGLRGLDRHAEAIERAAEALQLAREDGDARSESQALHETGVALHAQHEGERAVPVLVEAIAIRERVGYERGVGLSRIILGLVHLEADRIPEAIKQLTLALTELELCHDRFDAARAAAWLGRARARAGEFVKATDLLTGALRDFRGLGSAPWQARVLHLLGATAEEQQHLDRALQLYAQALALADSAAPQDAEHYREALSRVTDARNKEETP